MHHGDGMDEVLRKMAEGAQLGATGRFPGGKLGESDEGEIRLVVGVVEGKVVVNFGKPVAWLGMEREEAMGLARGLIKHARRLVGGGKGKRRPRRRKAGKELVLLRKVANLALVMVEGEGVCPICEQGMGSVDGGFVHTERCPLGEWAGENAD